MAPRCFTPPLPPNSSASTPWPAPWSRWPSRPRLRLERPSEFKEVAGRGVSARLNGDEILVGRSSWLTEQGADMAILTNPDYEEPEGLSTLYVVRNASLPRRIGLEDRTRPEARSAIDELREVGIPCRHDGHRRPLVRRTARRPRDGLHRRAGRGSSAAEAQAGRRTEAVRASRAVVGDGVNDAPALAAGDLGIAMGAVGSDVAINSASIALMNNDLRRLPFLIRLSRATTKVVWQNLLFGLSYLLVLEVLAVLGYITAVPAAILHTIASAFVIFNSARLVRFGEHIESSPPVAGRAKPAPEPPGSVAAAPALA